MHTSASNATLREQASLVLQDQHSRVKILSITLLIATLWLTTRPYVGVMGDSRLYTVQALNALMPGRFAEDLYFRYGSQDQFTLFSWVYKPFLAAFGIAGGNLALTVLGQGLWVTGLFYLARSMFRNRTMALVAVTAAIVLPGNLDFLRPGEAILTPRIFAEAFTLYAMGLMLRGQPVRALLWLCLSITIHPLMTLPGLAVLFFYEAIKRPALWLLGALVIIVTLVLAICGIQPFTRLFVSFDPAWLAVVRVRDFFGFVTEWGVGLWLTECNTFALAALALTVADPSERRLLGTVLAVSLCSFVVSLIGGDFLHNVLIVDIQTWRAAWLLAVVTQLSIGPVFLRIQKQGKSSVTNAIFLLALALALLALSGFIPQLCLVSAPMAVIAWLVAAWEHRRQRGIPILARVVVFLCVGITCAITMIFVYLAMAELATAPIAFTQTTRGITLTVVTLGAIGVYLAGPMKRLRPVRPFAMLGLSIALLTFAGFNWDQRSQWTKFVDTTSTPPTALTTLLPGNSTIYWDGDVTVPWFVLKRPSYFSCTQGTGAVFSRGTAINYQHRYESFEPLHTLDFGRHSFCPSSESYEMAPLRRDDLSALCKREPGLGALVLTKPAEDDPGEIWVSPVNFEVTRPVDGKLKVFKTDKFFIYSCSKLR